jgi:hypothetical protein
MAEFEHDERLKTQRNDAQAERSGPGHPLGRAAALGNSAIQRLLRSADQRQDDGSGPLDDEVARAIDGKRGTGQGLDSGAGRDLGATMGDDFSDVRVHTDAESDQLNRTLKADAFTTGTDIFFRQGKYNPGSSEGQKLLAHELTHVVQQRGASSSSEMTVSSPDDASEKQASSVAEQVSAGPATAEASLGRQEAPEDEQALQMSASVEREAAMPEDEELQMSASVDKKSCRSSSQVTLCHRQSSRPPHRSAALTRGWLR